MKNRDLAIKCYEKYLQTAPQSAEYEEIKLKLDKLENKEQAPSEESDSLLDKIVDFFTKKKDL